MFCQVVGYQMLVSGRIRLSAKGFGSHRPALATILPHEAPLRCRRHLWHFELRFPQEKTANKPQLFPRYSLQSFLGTFAEPSQLRFWFKQVWYRVGDGTWMNPWMKPYWDQCLNSVNNLFRRLGAICSLRRCRRNVLQVFFSAKKTVLRKNEDS